VVLRDINVNNENSKRNYDYLTKVVWTKWMWSTLQLGQWDTVHLQWNNWTRERACLDHWLWRSFRLDQDDVECRSVRINAYETAFGWTTPFSWPSRFQNCSFRPAECGAVFSSTSRVRNSILLHQLDIEQRSIGPAGYIWHQGLFLCVIWVQLRFRLFRFRIFAVVSEVAR
jgi:hypothetical protein